MHRQNFVLTTLASALALALAMPAAAQQTGAQAVTPKTVIAPGQLNVDLEELARGQAALALDRAKVTEMLGTSYELKAELAAELAAEFARQVGQGVGAGVGRAVATGPVFVGRPTADKERGYYDRGTSALDSGRWQAAVDSFNEVIKIGGTRTEGALYWKAYAQNRLGQRNDGLATLDELIKKYPSGRWAGEAKALQVEVRQLVGQPVRPEQESDDELKLLAIRGLMNTDADRAVPLLENLLQGNAAPKLKDQALFVLGMSESPKAREILVGVARGKGNPDLQLRAIRYLGFRNAEQNRPILMEIYKSTNDVDIKRRVIDALVGSAGGLGINLSYALAGAQYKADVKTLGTLTDADKRDVAAAAIANALWSLYQSESQTELKKQMLQALAVAQSDKVKELARTEKNLELRKAAIQNLGLMVTTKTGDLLVSLYKDEKDPELKKSIVRGLYTQRNAAALVQIARQETDSAVKKDVVEKLSTMKDKVATDYMLELLKK